MSHIAKVITARPRDIGGFSVRRLLPHARCRAVGPFIFFDEMGPTDFPPGEAITVRPHPHIGLATVSYLFEGAMMHRDSLGTVQRIEPGAVNLMTAGCGITHSERGAPDLMEGGHRFHGIQTWMALPKDLEETHPAFAHISADRLPSVALEGGEARIILGRFQDASSPVQAHGRPFCMEARLASGAELAVPGDVEELGFYVVAGTAEVGGERVEAQTFAVLSTQAVAIRAAEPLHLMLCGGARLDGDRQLWWNFVTSRPERMAQAKADWQRAIDAGFQGTPFVLPPGESEYIPLPGDHEGPPERSSECMTS